MRYFEDIAVGDIQRAGSYLLTETDIIEFATRWDPWPYHTNVDAANESFLGGLTASGVHKVCISCRLLHDIDTPAVISLLGTESQHPNPARVGDELHVESKTIEKRESKSRPDRGIVKGLTQLINQDGVVVLETTTTLLVANRPSEAT